MRRWILLVLVGVLVGVTLAPVPAQASHLPGKTIVLLGGIGRNAGEVPWQMLRAQLAMRGFPPSQIVEFQYAGGGWAPDGSWVPAAGGACESYSKASFLALRQLMVDLKQRRPNDEIFLVGHGVGGFVATQALWAAAFQADDPAIWENLSGIASISGPMAGLSTRRTTFLFTQGGAQTCVDLSMVAWMDEVGDDENRYAVAEERGAGATALGYKVGSFGNTVDCLYRYTSPEICPQVTAAIGGPLQAIGLQALGDERLTQFVKTGTMWKEYNVTGEFPGDIGDNHTAMLLDAGPMAQVAEFVLSQTR
jgi:pimeloyl-ACP methyl ester carboxylesterase